MPKQKQLSDLQFEILDLVRAGAVQYARMGGKTDYFCNGENVNRGTVSVLLRRELVVEIPKNGTCTSYYCIGVLEEVNAD